ncbi:hypothetical protein [Antrihabitans spumae]|uniref:Uncharacterized protein n=1 Tax=Antrihabitans spumae TaxID=3373370 RepID=A0ABW7KWK0_9NOCA
MRAFGNVLSTFGRPTDGIGLAGMTSSLYRWVQSTFHVDQHRRIDAAEWDRANWANALRIADFVNWSGCKPEIARSVSNEAIPTKSCRYALMVCLAGLRVLRSIKKHGYP